MNLDFTAYARQRMRARKISFHLDEIVVAMGKQDHVNHRTVRFSWNEFSIVVDTMDWKVITAYDSKEVGR